MYLVENAKKAEKTSGEVIHSGHFMVSHFEAEAQDDDEIAVPIPDIPLKDSSEKAIATNIITDNFVANKRPQIMGIETNLSKLFQCMSIAYRQKLTSPKWNRFRGIRLRWKDKIRLNNVIWRCWHMQFIKKQSTLICQFASPLDVDTHNKPEAIVLEGKYWKRKLEAVMAEYKKWRMFYKNQSMESQKDANDLLLEMELLKYGFQSDSETMLMDEDYMGLMSDTLFSTICNQPFAFPDTREIAKAGLSHFIQPSLGPLQPNLPNNEYMDLDHFDILGGKLPTVPEEHSGGDTHLYNKQIMWGYHDFNIEAASDVVNIQMDDLQTMETPRQLYSDTMMPPLVQYNVRSRQEFASTSTSTLAKISKPKKEPAKAQQVMQVQQHPLQTTPLMYPGYGTTPPMMELGTGPTMGHEPPMQSPGHRAGEYKVLDLDQKSQIFGRSGGSYASPKMPPNNFQPTQNYKGKGLIQNQPTPMYGSQSSKHQHVKDDKSNGMRSIHRNRRSRSNSREPMKRPPLQSAVSDPSLITPSGTMILAQLLTNSSETLYRPSQSALEPTIRCKEEAIPILTHGATNPSPVIISPLNMTKPPDIMLQTNLTPNTSSESHSHSSPTSPHGSVESLNRETVQRPDRRTGHIHAEQKRRYNIKNGFDMMHSLIPHLHQNPNAKLSKAAMLQKGAEYITELRRERDQLKDEMETLRQQIESLTTSISNCQSLLPATGAPVSRRRDTKMQEMFDEYVRRRTMENWKFWIFSLLFRPLIGTFNNFVTPSNLDDLYKMTLRWVEQHCTLGELRPVVFNSLKYLSTKTDILSNPEQLPSEARKQVMQPIPNSLMNT